MQNPISPTRIITIIIDQQVSLHIVCGKESGLHSILIIYGTFPPPPPHGFLYGSFLRDPFFLSPLFMLMSHFSSFPPFPPSSPAIKPLGLICCINVRRGNGGSPCVVRETQGRGEKRCIFFGVEERGEGMDNSLWIKILLFLFFLFLVTQRNPPPRVFFLGKNGGV